MSIKVRHFHFLYTIASDLALFGQKMKLFSFSVIFILLLLQVHYIFSIASFLSLTEKKKEKQNLNIYNLIFMLMNYFAQHNANAAPTNFDMDSLTNVSLFSGNLSVVSPNFSWMSKAYYWKILEKWVLQY